MDEKPAWKDLEYESWFWLWNGDTLTSPADRICWYSSSLWALRNQWVTGPTVMYGTQQWGQVQLPTQRFAQLLDTPYIWALPFSLGSWSGKHRKPSGIQNDRQNITESMTLGDQVVPLHPGQTQVFIEHLW